MSDSGSSRDSAAAGDTAPPIAIADLLRELQETNRLLRAIALQRRDDRGTQQDVLSGAPPPSSPAPGSSQAQSEPPADLATVRRKARELVEEFARAAFGPGASNLEIYRDLFLTAMLTRQPWDELTDPRGEIWDKITRLRTQAVPIEVSLTGSGRPSVLLWHRRPALPLTPGGGIHLTDGEVAQFPFPVQFELDRVVQETTRSAGWILGKNPAMNGFLCATPLVNGPGRKLLPASAVLNTVQKTNPVAASITDPNFHSPGSLWHFTTPPGADRVLPVERLALITKIAMKRRNDDWDTVHDFLQEFCAAWRPLYLRGRAREFGGWTGNGDEAYQHTIRCFSPNGNSRSDYAPSVHCHRETGNFPAFPGTSARSFVEQRMSVLCRWSYSEKPYGFLIMVLGDFQSERIEAQETNDIFTDWEDRHFTVTGENGGYHLLQSVLHRMLMYWEKEWSRCLDELENSINTKLHDVLSDEASNTLMFDTSFVRSRVYFKTLEMLRIFGDTIRETGRDLQEMDPERILQGSFRHAGHNVRYFLREDPLQDTALWENWEKLSSFQQKAEDRLLRRIAEKTEEIKSLRDGLFNATSLRESSQSTTMNRYVIVFTIMTVLYLPPSFIAGLFSTPLFEGAEQVGDQFRTATIVACAITYVIAVLFIWVADRWDIAGALFREMRLLWRASWRQYKKLLSEKRSSGSREELNASSDDAGKRV